MTEKRVSVRLAAVGGRQVRAELEGVGEAGARGFGRLSREMEAANARMAAFSRRVKVAAAAAVAAATAAGVAMVRSGLQTVDAQAKLAQSLGTTVASIQTLERAGELAGVSMSGIEQATKDLTRRLSQAAAGTGPAAQALERLGLSASDLLGLPLDARVGAINAAIESFVPVAERAAVAGQLFGEEGSIAMSRIDTATLRQATEDVRAFGVVVSETDADQIERTNDAISRLGLIWRGLSNQLAVAAAPALEAVADAMATLASRTGPLGRAITGLFDNIGRLTTYAATFAAFLASRWVAGLAAAALSVRGLATALVVMRGALIRTGIGALIVGAGELIYQFTKLVRAAGGVGEAMGLLRDVAAEVWDRIGLSLKAQGAVWASVYNDLKADVAGAMQSTVESVARFGNAAANTFEGAILAAKAIWGNLPAVVGEAAFGAANKLLDGVEAMLNGAIRQIDAFTGKIRAALAAVGIETTFGKIEPITIEPIANSFAGAAEKTAGAAKAAFEKAFADNPLRVPDLGLEKIALDALTAGNAWRDIAQRLAEAAGLPLQSWKALRDVMVAAGGDGEAAAKAAAEAAAKLASELNRAGGAGKQAREELTGWDAVAQSLSDYARSAQDWGKGISDSLTSAFRNAESAFASFVKTGKLDFRSLVSSMLADLARLAFRQNILGPIAEVLFGAIKAPVSHAGGVVGAPGAPMRAVPALAFAAAPRLHGGGWAGLRPDEVPTILQRGERVLSRQELARAGASGTGGAVTLTVNVEGARGNAEIEQMVAAGVNAGLSEYDREVLPVRIGQVRRNPRNIG